jgi:hypothetical protein
MNSYDEIQCEELMSGDEFLAWVNAMEQMQESRDEFDREWDEKNYEIEGMWLDNQPMPW